MKSCSCRRRLAGFAATAALTVWIVGVTPAGAATPSAWPQFGSNAAHTSVNSHETTLSTSNVAHLSHRWSQPDYSPGVPIAADGLVYMVGYDRVVRAFNATTGALKWSFAVAGGTQHATSLVVVGGVLYTEEDGELYALDARSGDLLHETPMVSSLGLAYSHGVIYAQPARPDGLMGAYDAATGDQLWTVSLGGATNAVPTVAGGRVFAWANGHGNSETTLSAYSAATGGLLWSRLISHPAHGMAAALVAGPPVVSGKKVVIATTDGHLWALSASTGAVIWKKRLGTPAGVALTPPNSAPAVYRGRVFQTTEGRACTSGRSKSTLTVRSLTTGVQVWSRVYENIPCSQVTFGTSISRSPVIANGLVYLTEMNAMKIRVYRTGGRLAAVFPTSEIPATSAIVAAGHVYVSEFDSSADTGAVEGFAP